MPILDGAAAGAIDAAAAALVRGELVALPTETVYGLGARADVDAAVARIFAAKGRPQDHPLIVHVASVEAADDYAASMNDAARRLIAAFWPGPMTVVVPRRPGRGQAAAGGQASIALRMPAHPVTRAVLREAASRGVGGVAAPSANRFGRVSPTTAAHVQSEFGAGLLILDGGPCLIGIESTIVDCTRERPALLRPGQLDRGRIEQVLGGPLQAADAASPRASGTLESHYAPEAPVHLLSSDQLALRLRAVPRAGAAVAVYSRLVPEALPGLMHRAMPDDAAAVAHELFAVLRLLDETGATAIWVEQPPPGPQWDGVRDRLQRASA